MIEFWVLLAVFLILYIAESLVWVRAGAVGFRLWSNPARALGMVTEPRISPRSTVTFVFPFIFRNEIIVSSPLPILPSPEGIALDPMFISGAVRHESWAFEDIRHITTNERKIVINEKTFFISSSEGEAVATVEFLRRLKNKPPSERKAQIEKEIASRLDPKLADARLKEFLDRTFTVSLSSLALLIFVFILSPIAITLFGLGATWRYLLGFMIFNVLLIIWDFYRADRELFGAEKTIPWSDIFTILLSPPAALRATKYLAKNFAYEYHPLALAAARCSTEDFRALASITLRELLYSADSDCGNGVSDDPAANFREWFRNACRTAVAKVVKDRGQNPDDLIAAPPRESSNVQSYCPRCLSQFLMPEGVCVDCNRISLRRFEIGR
jgi:hypothetical protein